MIVHRFALAPVAIGLLLATISGCGAGNGGACQLPGDCASGLICCKNSVIPSERGVCRPSGTVEGMCAPTTDSGAVDAFVPTDAFVSVDANVDANLDADVDAGDASTVDAGDGGGVDGSTDGGGVDGGGVDGGGVDSGTEDASLEDASADTGVDAAP